ncbi:hypothetical protein Tco_0936015, partial [Tanacetum coccineum]
VPEVYMHQFWDSVYKHDTFYKFKIDKRKRFKLNLEVFRDIFKIRPRVQGQDFDALPIDEEIMSFLRDLGHTGEIHSLNDVVIDQMHQPWRNFAALINRSLSGKKTGIDKLYLSRAQILWGMYHQKNVDYVELLLEDFIYQIDNKAYKKQEKMYYPRFTKVIIHYFLTQDKTLSWRNKIGMHTSNDDYLINTLRFVSTKEETQIYGATPPKKARKFKKSASPKITTVPVSTEEPTGKSKRVKRSAKKSTKAPARGVIIRETPEMLVSKKKEKVDVTRGKGIELLSQVALNGDAQFKEIIPSVTSKGTGVKPEVPDVTEEESSENNENKSDSALINRSLSGKTTGLDKLHLSRAQILWGMYHQKNVDYVELLWEDFIYQIDNKAYKKQEKMKSKRVKRPAKKSTKAPTRGVVIRETLEIPLSKKKEKVDVTRDKGIELLSQVALNEDAQFEEGNDVDDSNNEQDSIGEDSDQKNDSDDDKTQSDNENESDSKHKTDENESGSEFDQDENEEDEEEVKDELVKTPSNDSDDEDETKITDKVEGDEDEEIDYTTSQLYDDVDMWLNEPVDSDKGFVQ